jgi:hypothetical protein
MNWEALGAIGEIVGAVAVVLTLGYLAVQTRQNTRAVRVASFHQIVDSFSAVSLAVVQDPSLSSLLMRSIVDPRNLTAEDYSRYGFFLLTFLRRAESMFFHSEQGTLQRESWHGIRVTLEELLATEPAQRWWSLNAHRFNPTFRDYVVAELLGKEEAAGGAISSIVRP